MKFTVFILVLISGFQAFAQSNAPCTSISNQHEMNDCAKYGFSQADHKLNQTWKALGQCMNNSPSQWSELVKAQKDWIQYKESHCMFDANLTWGSGPERGSGWPVGYFGCLAQATNQRIDYLNDIFQYCQN